MSEMSPSWALVRVVHIRSMGFSAARNQRPLDRTGAARPESFMRRVLMFMVPILLRVNAPTCRRHRRRQYQLSHERSWVGLRSYCAPVAPAPAQSINARSELPDNAGHPSMFVRNGQTIDGSHTHANTHEGLVGPPGLEPGTKGFA